jgi:hypothetical protein
MNNIKILTEYRDPTDNEIILSRSLYLNKNNDDAIRLINFIERICDVKIEWIYQNELIGDNGQQIGLRIIKKDNHNV